jgi:hypothetical protein
MNKGKEMGEHRPGNGDMSRGETRTAETAQRARGFFERASERVRDAAREIGQRARGRDRDYGRDYSPRDQSYGGREPQYYGQEQSRSYAPQGYARSGYRDENRMYGGREQSGRGDDYGGEYRAREWGRDDQDRDREYGRSDFRERDERLLRANFGGGYRMREENRNFGNDWGRDDRDRHERYERDDNNRGRGRW